MATTIPTSPKRGHASASPPPTARLAVTRSTTLTARSSARPLARPPRCCQAGTFGPARRSHSHARGKMGRPRRRRGRNDGAKWAREHGGELIAGSDGRIDARSATRGEAPRADRRVFSTSSAIFAGVAPSEKAAGRLIDCVQRSHERCTQVGCRTASCYVAILPHVAYAWTPHARYLARRCSDRCAQLPARSGHPSGISIRLPVWIDCRGHEHRQEVRAVGGDMSHSWTVGLEIQNSAHDKSPSRVRTRVPRASRRDASPQLLRAEAARRHGEHLVGGHSYGESRLRDRISETRALVRPRDLIPSITRAPTVARRSSADNIQHPDQSPHLRGMVHVATTRVGSALRH